MKMSLCNTFRLFVVSLIIVLSSIDTPAAFTLRRTAGGGESSRDLAQESVSLQIKNELKASSTTLSTLKSNDNLILNSSLSTPRTGNGVQGFDTYEIIESNNSQNPDEESQVLSSDPPDLALVNGAETTTEPVTTSEYNNESVDKTTPISEQINNEPKAITSNSRKVEFIQNEAIAVSDATEILPDSTFKLDEPEITTSYESENLPTWKKYTTIDRKRPVATTIDDEGTPLNKTEEMIKAETKPLRVSLQDTVTSDIPSLEQLKNELLNSTLKDRALESETETVSLVSTEINTPPEESSIKWDTFESKRAGYLDLSQKVSNERTVVGDPEFKVNSKETIRAMFEIEGVEADMAEDKNENRMQSQSQLNEDAIKEELLKEKLINENNENADRFDPTIQPLLDVDNSNYTSIQFNTFNELSVKPINGDKVKNTTLYAVNPNYKPLKKIEVQAPKQFVRDPDDNSWRNESLSSLGIVFKPKNSSKPFTQVLKNKTETEWNSLMEKDSKNDIPDLKERLQKMAEMRKSKRKKTDSFGNIVYFDYEENSSSGEHSTTDQPLSAITSSAESLTTDILDERSNNSSEVSDVTTPIIFTTEKARGKVRNSYSTRKFRKFFNVPEYYDSTDEDDVDYLNMAKIDIKKFTTSPKTVPTTTPTPTQRPWTFNKVSHTISPERKATIQYFPPLSTQKVNINDYDSDFKHKVNSFTNTEPPTNILPVSLDRPLTIDNSHQYKTQNEKVKPFEIATKPEFNRNSFYSTQPPHTTQTEFTLLNSDGNYDRDSYVIRHYKDYLSEAAKDNDFDKNIDYVPYTKAPPQDVTQTDLITYVTEKAKMNIDNEYDYETQFRKDVLQRFVDNFNQNSERYKSEFPILFNNSVIHRDTENGRDIASSRAFMRGLYNTNPKIKHAQRESYDPNNDNMTVELSPSYELHYYMPEQEEKEVAVPQPVTLPYQYRL
ncbi:uncharacterized protein LOC125064951 [Vanessa atalanta]|uniref:uncharacterized protein LOC125064951 n=1 Tax=Vanessa atalanta TaxID=42275 RepID=UPI001FCD8654|nr:uncharacterized protein LOC125064951 [Vanessa atalanta]